jgi:DNA polymerase V
MIRGFQQRAEQKITGFQSPASDYLEGRLNIADVLVIDPHCTFYFAMDSEAMKSRGLIPGDILVVDRSVTPVHGAVVVAVVQGTFCCRTYDTSGSRPVLTGDAAIIESSDGDSMQIWGVVTSVCRGMLPAALKKGRYSRVCAL